MHAIRKIPLPSYSEVISSNNVVDTFNYQLDITPNPASITINISYVLPTNVSTVTIKIIDEYNSVGSELFSEESTDAQTDYTINVNNIPNGNYLVVLQVANKIITSKHLLILR